jgi:hypothetical protein
MNQNPDKTDKNRKKPVETEDFMLTKPLEKAKVNCGTVLHTRMNIDDRASSNDVFSSVDRRARRAARSLF